MIYGNLSSTILESRTEVNTEYLARCFSALDEIYKSVLKEDQYYNSYANSKLKHKTIPQMSLQQRTIINRIIQTLLDFMSETEKEGNFGLLSHGVL